MRTHAELKRIMKAIEFNGVYYYRKGKELWNMVAICPTCKRIKDVDLDQWSDCKLIDSGKNKNIAYEMCPECIKAKAELENLNNNMGLGI